MEPPEPPPEESSAAPLGSPRPAPPLALMMPFMVRVPETPILTTPPPAPPLATEVPPPEEPKMVGAAAEPYTPPPAWVVPAPPAPPYPAPPAPVVVLPAPGPNPDVEPVQMPVVRFGPAPEVLVPAQPLASALIEAPASTWSPARPVQLTLALIDVVPARTTVAASSMVNRPWAPPVKAKSVQVVVVAPGILKSTTEFIEVTASVVPFATEKLVPADQLNETMVGLQVKAPPSVTGPEAVTDGVAEAATVGSQYWFVAEESVVQEATAKSASV